VTNNRLELIHRAPNGAAAVAATAAPSEALGAAPRAAEGASAEPLGPPPAVAGPPTVLRLCAGFVYFFFGFLKLFPDLSPAELIAGETLTRISGHTISATTALWWLALMETTIGLCFLMNVKLHWVFFVFMVHQASTFLPLFIVPELCFKFAPFAPTMEGQYIIKNLISVAAGYTVMLPAVKSRWNLRKWRRRAKVAR